MSMTLSTLCSLNPTLRPLHCPSKSFSHAHLSTGTHRLQITPFHSSPIRLKPSKPGSTSAFSGVFLKTLGLYSGRNNGFSAKSENAEGESKTNVDEAEQEARGQSTLPERFRYLTKEAPDKPVRWPWFVALTFAAYAWRTVFYELYNWKKAAVGIIHFLGALLKALFALILYFIGDPITSIIRGIETALYTIRAFYSEIVAYAPIPELTLVIVLASAVLAVGEATVPDSVTSQPYLLTLAGLIGFVAVRSLITELFFWILLVGLFSFARFVKKKDHVSSALPVAAVLAAVGEPWVRVVVMVSYLALAISHHSKNSLDGKDSDATAVDRKVPIPLVCAALAIGIRVAAKWVGYRHLTWMIV